MQSQLEQIRTELEQLPHELHWNVSPDIGQFLRDYVISLGATKLLEFGTSNGYSSLWLIEAILDAKNSKLWTIESNQNRFEEATESFTKAGVIDILTQVKGHAPEILVDHPEIKGVQFAFIDATKKEYESYLLALMPRLDPNGVIIADNIRTHHDSLEDFIETSKKLSGYTVLQSLELGTGMIAIIPTSISQKNQQLLEQTSGHKWTSIVEM